MASAAPTPEPSIRAIDFSSNGAVMQVSTMLRRLWLVDPDTLEGSTVQEKFQGAAKTTGSAIALDPPEERFDDAVWKSRAPPSSLLDPPAGSSRPEDDEQGAGPLFTEFRQMIYGVCNHIFWDVYQSLKATAADEEITIGEFKPPSTTVMILRTSPDEAPEIRHFLSTDTFVYPLWIAPDVTLSLKVDDEENTLEPDGKTWTKALWVPQGKTVIFTPQESGERKDRVVAVLVLGLSEARPAPKVPLIDNTIGRSRMTLKDAKQGGAEGDGPETWPESDHLARAIFLQAGDAVESCSFDDEYYDERQGEAATLEPPAKEAGDDAETEEAAAPLYSPLPGNSTIRIIVIEPGAPDAEIRTRLVVVNLDDKPEYEAISYTWGDPKDKTFLRCNKSTVPIPWNLERALRRLRHPTRPRNVWADSVCINQEDIPERGQQVSIMRYIYQAAKRVLVWLGLDAADKAAVAFQAVCHIVRAWRPEGDRVGFEGYASILEPMTDDELDSVRSLVDKKSWDALRALYETEYFRRFWIIQELALGRSAVVIWGDHHISWGLIGICASWMMTAGWSFCPTDPIPAACNAFLIHVLPLAKRSGISMFSKLDLSVVLGITMGLFDSTDARDRIFALLGMSFAGNDPDRELLIQPNYSQDLSGVYTAATRRILQQDQHLRVLSAVQHGPELDDLDSGYPSWVPRWNEKPHADPLGLRDEQGFYANGGELFCPSTAAATATFPDAQTVVLNGLECGVIATVSEEPFRETGMLASSTHGDALVDIFNELNSEAKQYRASWSATLEKFNMFGSSDPEYQANVVAGGAATGAIVVSQPGKYGTRMSVEMVTGERAQADHLGELFTLGDGRVGLGPAAAREGDVVVVLFGAVVPFVLRAGCERDKFAETGGGGGGPPKYWRLVGECFVPELMQGEAVEKAGLLAEGKFERYANGSLALAPPAQGESDPRLERKVGEHGVVAFEIR
ncbi:heterokaryon incompatibility protein-domain-containing protein [Cladorrhinum samala]|uniref:Heterokaryon incompatibility protein-domain-containing protein n=1 Tax=Cladorrhinum samala TaxID=585594 RepID=A0AAV9H8Z7_9PEZI|nr:heterokaryon incompatibility protein-domain-containing protein [Cladorrhinum samala]